MMSVFPLSGPQMATITIAVSAAARSTEPARRIAPLRRCAAELGGRDAVGPRPFRPAISTSFVVMPRTFWRSMTRTLAERNRPHKMGRTNGAPRCIWVRGRVRPWFTAVSPAGSQRRASRLEGALSAANSPSPGHPRALAP